MNKNISVFDKLKCHNLCSKYLPFSLTQVWIRMSHPRHSVSVTLSRQWWSSLIRFMNENSVLWHCWLGHQTCKNHRPYNLYCVGTDVKPCSINLNQLWFDHGTLCCLTICHSWLARGRTAFIAQCDMFSDIFGRYTDLLSADKGYVL